VNNKVAIDPESMTFETHCFKKLHKLGYQERVVKWK